MEPIKQTTEFDAKEKFVKAINDALIACDPARYGYLRGTPIKYEHEDGYPNEYLTLSGQILANVIGDSPAAILTAIGKALS